jgi:hypothetical protein
VILEIILRDSFGNILRGCANARFSGSSFAQIGFVGWVLLAGSL